MYGTVNGFTYGWVTPVAAYVMACLGAALGLRCTVRALVMERSRRAGWLALGALSIGSGIWTMHFIAMIGFSVDQVEINYDKSITFASLAVAIAVVGAGVFLVGFLGRRVPVLLASGAITGVGVAAMHYLGMAGMKLRADLTYNTTTVALSIGVAVFAATAALWAAVSIKGLAASLGASFIMGVAVTGMHYTGMAALRVHLHDSGLSGSLGGASSAAILAPVLIGPVVFLFLAGVVVALDPPVSEPEPGREPVPEPVRGRRSW
ncbi:MHYT domain-containing protein [Streptomyces sp. H10-C2]|uniref:MHYT domain-containing protein n=1 Tax=unclassified Streptomyces TaxID=2593676 RepID=UPI0024BA2D4F|nr:MULTISPECIES: MHYT domain-containing protein [unclassified Streptomyces]MDJ0346917.1 MHYT domain-containing protein [Streptomyces sp. PH10-H1]MDJ0375248.1 MHYT domain-containing protein [Streptomyces sp. H10-C2]